MPEKGGLGRGAFLAAEEAHTAEGEGPQPLGAALGLGNAEPFSYETQYVYIAHMQNTSLINTNCQVSVKCQNILQGVFIKSNTY